MVARFMLDIEVPYLRDALLAFLDNIFADSAGQASTDAQICSRLSAVSKQFSCRQMGRSAARKYFSVAENIFTGRHQPAQASLQCRRIEIL